MSNINLQIKEFLQDLMQNGRSSPLDWQSFYEFLKSKKIAGGPMPPVPLILAASGESNHSKHIRLGQQLSWALENDCIDEAINYLKRIPLNEWNSGTIEDWNKDSYWV